MTEECKYDPDYSESQYNKLQECIDMKIKWRYNNDFGKQYVNKEINNGIRILARERTKKELNEIWERHLNEMRKEIKEKFGI